MDFSLNSNLAIYPGTKLQLENVTVRGGVIILKPSNVAWIGGDVESFRVKFESTCKSKQADRRRFERNLGKNETPPPQFEDVDPTGYRKRKKVIPQGKYKEDDYNDPRVYQDDPYGRKGHRSGASKGGRGGYHSQHYDDGTNYEDEEYYEDDDANGGGGDGGNGGGAVDDGKEEHKSPHKSPHEASRGSPHNSQHQSPHNSQHRSPQPNAPKYVPKNRNDRNQDYSRDHSQDHSQRTSPQSQRSQRSQDFRDREMSARDKWAAEEWNSGRVKARYKAKYRERGGGRGRGRGRGRERYQNHRQNRYQEDYDDGYQDRNGDRNNHRDRNRNDRRYDDRNGNRSADRDYNSYSKPDHHHNNRQQDVRQQNVIDQNVNRYQQNANEPKPPTPAPNEPKPNPNPNPNGPPIGSPNMANVNYFGQSVNTLPGPKTLMDLYAVKPLPFTATIRAEITSAILQYDAMHNNHWIEFMLSDSTGTCKGMTSTYLMQWIVSKYSTNSYRIDQQMVNGFFAQWGKRYISIKMELQDPRKMVIFHEIKWN